MTGETSMIRHRRAVPVLVLTTLLLPGLLGACGGDEPTSLPELSSSPSVSASGGLSAAEQEVADRVALYARTLDDIAGGDKLDMKRLRAVAVDSWAQTLGENLQQTKAQGFVVEGEKQRTFKSVSVTGEAAEYVECTDQRKTRLVKNGKPEPDGPQQTDPPTLTTITLVKRSGVWKVQTAKGGGTC
jgi:hypothetical protein